MMQPRQAHFGDGACASTDAANAGVPGESHQQVAASPPMPEGMRTLHGQFSRLISSEGTMLTTRVQPRQAIVRRPLAWPGFRTR